MKEFAERLWHTREARKLLVTQLNEAAGLSKGSVSRHETTKRNSLEADTLHRLANALGVTMDWLWAGREDPHAGAFLEELDRRKLKEVIEREPTRWRLSTVAKALDAEVLCDKSGVPVYGWNVLLDELEAGEAAKLKKRRR